MGIRMAQPQGLNPWATKLVEGQLILLYSEHGVRTYPNGKTEEFNKDIRGSNVASEQYDHYYGMGDEDVYPLMRYTVPDLGIVEECIHFTVWSSGPMIFLALKQNGEWIKESLWTVEEVNKVETGLVDELFLQEVLSQHKG